MAAGSPNNLESLLNIKIQTAGIPASSVVYTNIRPVFHIHFNSQTDSIGGGNGVEEPLPGGWIAGCGTINKCDCSKQTIP